MPSSVLARQRISAEAANRRFVHTYTRALTHRALRAYLVRGDALNARARGADTVAMDRLHTETDALRERALALAAELGIDRRSWYLLVLEEGRANDVDADLGALVRAYWELQRMTGRADLRAQWRSLADRLWHDG